MTGCRRPARPSRPAAPRASRLCASRPRLSRRRPRPRRSSSSRRQRSAPRAPDAPSISRHRRARACGPFPAPAHPAYAPEMAEAIEESIDIDAPPERVYEMVADLSRMGEWSPENQGGQWLRGATGAAQGARFKGSNRNGWRRWRTVAHVVTADPGREVAWESRSFGLKIALWRYRFVPNERGGTTVIESTEDRRGTVMNIVGPLGTGVRDRSGDHCKTMGATLQ